MRLPVKPRRKPLLKPRVYFDPDTFASSGVQIPRSCILHWDVVDGKQVVKIECTVSEADFIKRHNDGWFEWPK